MKKKMNKKSIHGILALALSFGLFAEPAAVSAEAVVSAEAGLPRDAMVYDVDMKSGGFTYDGKPHRCGITAEDMYGNRLKAGRDYTVTYSKDITSVGSHRAFVKFTGKYTGNEDYQFWYEILPGLTGVKKKTVGTKDISLSWDKVGIAKYYKVRIYLSADPFASKAIVEKKTKKTKIRLKGLEPGTEYIAFIDAFAWDKDRKEYVNGGYTDGIYNGDSCPVLFTTKGEREAKTPELTASVVSPDKVKLSWKTAKQVDTVRLFRRIKKHASAGGKFEAVGVFDGDTRTYSEEITSGKYYEYKLAWYQKSGSSYKKLGKAEKVTTVGGFKAPFVDVTGRSDGVNKPSFKVDVYTETDVDSLRADGFEIYKKTGNGKWKKVKRAKVDQNEETWKKAGYTEGVYIDKNIKCGCSTFYKARGFKTINGKTIYTDFSPAEKIKSLYSPKTSKVKVKLQNPEKENADHLVVKITNKNKKRKFYVSAEDGDDYDDYDNIEYYFGHFGDGMTISSYSTDGKTYRRIAAKDKQTLLEVSGGRSIWLKLGRKYGGKVDTAYSKCKNCYLIFRKGGMENGIGDTRLDLKTGAVGSLLDEN